MSRKNLLNSYRKDVERIKDSAKNLGLKDEEINKLLKESIDEIKSKLTSSKCCKKNLWAQKIYGNSLRIFISVFTFFSILLYVLLNVHTPTSSIVLRNVQGLTYPALRIVRTLSVPIIKMFPSLTDLYDESCLIENPYFYVGDMECWPCENVHSIIDLTEITELNTFNKIGEGTPFIAKTKQKEVFFKSLKELYINYTSELDSDSRRIKLVNTNIKTLQDLFSTNEKDLSSNFHIQWRINKMTAARIVKKLFPRPYFLPERSGQAVERFINIDGPSAGLYELPNTECSYVFIIQGTGERTIALKPSTECKDQCKTVSVVLKPSYVLAYNWWYWRPVSLPLKNTTHLSISYINSYC